MVELYYDAKLSKLRSGDRVRNSLQRIGRVYGWNERPLPSITDDDAAAMLQDIAEGGKKAMANQTKHIVHAMFKWAKQPGRKFATVNPFADLPAPGGATIKRDRYLSPDEIRRVWRALDEPGRFNVSGDAATGLRLILVTAARLRHGARHGRQRVARPERAERTRSALVAAGTADEGRERLHHTALGLGP